MCAPVDQGWMVGESGGTYVVRHGWTRTGLIWFAATVLFVGVGFLPHGQPPDMDHIELTFSPFACWIAAVCSSRRKVVRVDKRGVTLYRLLPFRKPEFVPWAEVTAVGWTVQTGGAWRRISSLEVLRRTAGPVAARPSTTTTEQLDIYLATQVEPGFVETFRNTDTIRRDTTLSDIDPVRLATAIAHLAPGARHFGDLGGLGLDRSNLPSPRTGPFQ